MSRGSGRRRCCGSFPALRSASQAADFAYPGKFEREYRDERGRRRHELALWLRCLERPFDSPGTIRQSCLMTTAMQPGTQKEFFKTSDGCSIAFRLRAERNAGAPRIVVIHSLAPHGRILNGITSRLDSHA